MIRDSHAGCLDQRAGERSSALPAINQRSCDLIHAQYRRTELARTLMTIDEQIRLELEGPSGDPVYAIASPLRVDAEQYEPWADDPVTRLRQGVWARDFELRNESARSVRALVLSEPEDRRLYPSLTVVQAVSHLNFELVGALVVELGIENALSWSVPVPASGFVARGIANALKHCPRTPTESGLADIVRWATHILSHVKEDEDSAAWMQDEVSSEHFTRQAASELLKVAKDTQRFRQRRTILDGENPVLDRDRRELLGRLERLAVPEDIRSLLHLADGSAENGDFKGGLEKLRTFLERTCEFCCRKAIDANVPLPDRSAGGSIAPWNRYAMAVNLLSKTEGDVVQALSTFLAMEGSHATGSKPEQYSVARTTVIEWCLLLSGRCS
jgi:hypothetical protein